ncbi:hypothetical protein O9X98_06665 [Agrobacterium salinitolerans]|nr:hypothetical protein [Agrobacterium salinitolerans]
MTGKPRFFDRAEPTAREAKIVQARDQGTTWREIAAQHGLTQTRVMDLYKTRKWIEQQIKENKDTPRGDLSSRSFNVVANILGQSWTKEQLRAIPRETLIDYPNCGEKTLAELDEYLALP